MRIDGTPSGQVGLSAISDILSKLSVGDVVRAQVLDIGTNEMLLKLFDGTVLTAAAMSQIEASRGDIVEFAVKSKEGSRIFLETLKNQKQSDQLVENELKKQLVELKIQPDSLNLEAAVEIKSQNLPLVKELIENTVEAMLNFKGLSVDKAVFLAANKPNVQENHISALNRLIEGKVQIGSQILELADILNSLSAVEKPQFQQFAGNETALNKIEHELDGLVFKIASDKKMPDETVVRLKDIIKNAIKDFGLSQESNKDDMLKALKPLMEDYSKSGRISENEIMKALSTLPREQAKQTEDPFGKLTKETFRKLANELGEIFVKIDSSNLDKDINVKKLYNNILNKLENLKETLHKAGSNIISNDISARVENLESNIRFFNEFNMYASYYQIPLNIRNSKTTGELYILKRDPKKRRIDAENLTAFISLDTENIGRVDTLLGLSKKNISISMRVEAQQLVSFLKEHYKELYNRMADKGYKLVDFKYRLIEDNVNLLNINKIIKKDTDGKMVSVDYRV
ncbi:MAG: flagellar hook-length control protein FliK [Clostridia bacterium]|nr:flagellar hook-length control protein FliK [Clostridia bacterium]